MSTTTRIGKWGNSLAVRIPKSVVRAATLDEGDTVDVSVAGHTIVIRSTRSRCGLDDLVAQITPENRHSESDWGNPVGGEVW